MVVLNVRFGDLVSCLVGLLKHFVALVVDLAVSVTSFGILFVFGLRNLLFFVFLVRHANIS